MLAASIHEHAGLGNQIWRYVCCRVFAENLGYDWGVSNPGWRGPFLNIDWGQEVPMNVEEDSDFNINSGFLYYKELSEPFPEVAGEIGKADPKFSNIENNTYINGNFQKYGGKITMDIRDGESFDFKENKLKKSFTIMGTDPDNHFIEVIQFK